MKIQVFTLLSLGVAFAVNGPSLGASQSDTAVGLGLQLATGFENTPGRFGTDRNVTSEPTSLNGMPGSGFGYVIETSLTDPEGCAAPLAAFDGMPDAYVNLEAFGILTDPERCRRAGRSDTGADRLSERTDCLRESAGT